jgi:naphtho-gamma-pyrone polyketide synthase
MQNVRSSTVVCLHAPCTSYLFLGDLTYDFRKDLLQLLHVKGCPSLADFFAQLQPAIQNEIASIPRREREWFPQSTDPVELVDNMDTTKGTPVMRFTLPCVYQLGRFLKYVYYLLFE